MSETPKVDTSSLSGLVKAEFFTTQESLPLIIKPIVEDLDLIEWGKSHRQALEQYLHQYGAILFRNFPISGTTVFEKFLKTIGGELLEYQYASTPRSRVSGLIYSSTEYPADQIIPLHNEESYALQWPMKLGFYCVRPADSEGETPIADSRQVYEKMPDPIRERFSQKGIMYVRNYGTGLDLSWESAFGTNDKSVLETYCRQAGIEFEWTGEKQLRTSQVCQATAIHPHTHEMVWFNQAHLFHISNLPMQVREALLECVPEKDLPRQAYYGDGTPIEGDLLDEIRRIYQEQAVLFPWRKGDVLIIDNMLTAHGRSAFSGDREIQVGMTTPYSKSEEI